MRKKRQQEEEMKRAQDKQRELFAFFFISVRLLLTTNFSELLYGITQCYLPPGSGDFSPLPQPKLVLDFAVLESICNLLQNA